MDYEINRSLGKSAAQNVFLAKNKISGHKVVLKYFEKPLKDAKILEGLNHPNLVKIVDSGVDDQDRGFYAMEYLRGKPLHEIVPQKTGLSFEASWDLVQGIFSGVAALHAAGILHLDLKPGNILVVSGEPKLIDIGMSVPLGQGNFWGTPGYVAPEIILGQEPDVRSDIYSLGALLSFIWTGKKFFRGDSPRHMLGHQITPGKYPQEELVDDPTLSKIIHKAMQQDPANRYQSVSDMLVALQACQHERAYRAEEPTEEVAQSQWGHWVVGAVIVSLLSIAVAIYYALLSAI